MVQTCWNCGKNIDGEQHINGLLFTPIIATMTADRYMNFDKNQHKPSEGRVRRMYCKMCYGSVMSEYKQDTDEYVRLKTKLMIERALRLFEKQGVDMYEHKEAIEAVSGYVWECPEKYMSADEIIAAIVLINNEIETKVQYKVGKYKVDFYLPTLKVVLEIDGHLHDHKQVEDNSRDIAIRNELGHEWEVIRIPTKYIESNAILLVEAIKSIRNKKKQIRRENNGILPETYSKREKVHYTKLVKK